MRRQVGVVIVDLLIACLILFYGAGGVGLILTATCCGADLGKGFEALIALAASWCFWVYIADTYGVWGRVTAAWGL
jgi:hypothetical protein